MAGGFRLIENLPSLHFQYARRNRPIHDVAAPIAKDGHSDRGQHGNLLVLKISKRRKDERQFAFLLGV